MLVASKLGDPQARLSQSDKGVFSTDLLLGIFVFFLCSVVIATNSKQLFTLEMELKARALEQKALTMLKQQLESELISRRLPAEISKEVSIPFDRETHNLQCRRESANPFSISQLHCRQNEAESRPRIVVWQLR